MHTTTHYYKRAGIITRAAACVCIGVWLMLWPSGASGQASGSLAPSDTTLTASQGGRWFVNLPGGGRIWATEDPSMGDPVLNVSGTSVAALQGQQLTEPITFRGYANYAPFIQRAELLIYRGRDETLNNPLVTLPVEPGLSMEIPWEGQLPDGHGLQQGGSLLYVMRVYGPGGQMDETYPRSIELLSPQQMQQRRTGNQMNSQTGSGNQRAYDGSETSSEGNASGQAAATESVFGRSNLRIQNIPIVGSAIRVQGQNIPIAVNQVTINGRSIPVDRDQRFVAEYLLPAGSHQFEIQLTGSGEPIKRTLQVQASRSHFFMVGIADVTASKNGLHGNLEPIEGSENFQEDLLVEGRMAFYLKAKVKGKYLITAQADTREEELQHMFDGFFGKNPQDLFRRIDPDRYYPVYGDDGSTHRDINSQGKFYVRVNWDKSEALWGNYSTRFTGTETARYQRGLYGGALRYNSPATTQWGQSKLQLAGFGSDAQTVYGHNEFVATGASVYYLRHTDVLAGSEQITVELRDVTTGQTTRQLTLQPDVDYEIDYLQGRLILKRPVAQMVQEQGQELIRDTPQADLQNVLLIDYEYIPSGLAADNITAGARGKAWLGEHVGVGGTYVNEGRGSADAYQLAGGDLTLRAGRGTYLKMEAAQSDKTQAPVFFSDNGGLTFTETIPEGVAGSRSGQAYRVEGQASLGTVFGGDSSGYWDRNPWTISSWWSKRDGGFSVTRRDFGYDIREWGAEVDGQVSEGLQLRGQVSHQQVTAPTGGAPTSTPLPGTAARERSQAQLIGDYRINDHHTVTGEVRQVRESLGGPEGEALLAAVGYEARLAAGLELYGIGQTDLWSGDDYRDNDRLTGGARYLWRDRTSLGGEYSRGGRGESFSVNASHQITQNYDVYGRYGWSPDYRGNALFGPTQQDGFSVGQRWRATDRLNVFHESQQIQSGSDTGLGHSLGLDFMPAEHWQLGLRLGGARLQAQSGRVDRRSVTATVGARDGQTNWSSKFEYRGDLGAEERTQLVTTQRIRHKINESWRLATRLNYADTDDKATAVADARFLESNFGVSLRPWNSTRWGLLGKVTYLYDRQSVGQLGSDAQALTGSNFDQRSLVGALEAIYRPHQRVELTAKGALRVGEIRNRSAGPFDQWFTSTTRFAALQLRYQVWGRWDALAEGRWRENLESDDARRGVLVGVDRRITDFLHIGAGYNFTDFSDRLTDLDYDDRGWFINIVGIY
ncbi:hypothetical protein [Fodinibius salsisoli]|uniref:Outer membrane beta-barrel protein n=1 Tax=Fodinibius salsisoli TaxID=2820877 RepID=A0ABT3PHM1_9BACT|nr:hypothetical protein [Fodinibius salsisoli]MCW9705421.1 outer membrane beta-barrel protein [Fodinibius salsisoli]